MGLAAVFCLFCILPGRAEALLYDHGFETGDTSEFSRTVPEGPHAFAGNETGVVRHGQYGGRMSLTLGSQESYVEVVLGMPLPDIHVKCAVRLGDDVEVFRRGELLSLTGSDPRTPAAALTLERDLTLGLVYFTAAGNLVSLPASGTLGPLVPGKWHELELHFRSALHPAGQRIEVFLDGVRTLEARPASTESLVWSVSYGQRMAWLPGTNLQGTVYYDLCKGSETYIGQETDKLAVVVVDRSPANRQAYEAYASERVKGFLDHVGLPYMELDAASVDISAASLRPFDLVILGQEGTGDFLALREQDAVAEAVRQGAGLVVFDPWLDRYRSPLFQQMLGGVRWDGQASVDALEVPARGHFITADQPPLPQDRRYTWMDPVPQMVVSDAGRNEVLATTDRGPAYLAGTYGEGRVCLWLVSSLLWDGAQALPGLRYLGRLNGLDDLVWRGLVWACRKPMAWRPVAANYLALKVDDCRGRRFGGEPFEYLEMASDALGVPVHATLFLDSIGQEQAGPLRRLEDLGKADISAHAFDGGDEIPAELSEWHIYWDFPNKRPFSEQELAERWARVEDFFARYGFTFSRMLGPSFGVVGVGNLPYLERHGIVYVNTFHDLGTVQGTGENTWPHARPFGNGAHALDFTAGGRGPFNVSNWADYHFYSFDYLVRADVVPYEPVAGPEEGWENAVRQMRFAYAARFPMLLLTHEYVLDVAGFDLDDWGRFLAFLRSFVEEEDVIPLGPVEMAGIVRDYAQSRIVSYVREPWRIRVLLEGEAQGPTHLEVWTGDDRPVHVPVPAFGRSRQVDVVVGTPPPVPGDGGGCGCSHLSPHSGDGHPGIVAFLPALLAWGWSRVLRRRASPNRTCDGKERNSRFPCAAAPWPLEGVHLARPSKSAGCKARRNPEAGGVLRQSVDRRRTSGT